MEREEIKPILVVDDDPGFRQLLETILTGEGFHVDTAGKVGEARRLCGTKSYSLVISDLKLRMATGWTFRNGSGSMRRTRLLS